MSHWPFFPAQPQSLSS
ncbi:hypothetical protein GQ607_006534 [Colletotrichum asianum]|uniref:Uncharacterized protein n=1 Tax=Colletotrichum asianum TaxID=702518 RepID=A0A8H3WIE2_9PEZI|nr:hypothetical protein GQ607_006534 [Colletotrichum asianum]